ncbi:MAG: hypothetical protein ABIT38_13830, partial [Gemmatimonadaceae bacterium]
MSSPVRIGASCLTMAVVAASLFATVAPPLTSRALVAQQPIKPPVKAPAKTPAKRVGATPVKPTDAPTRLPVVALPPANFPQVPVERGTELVVVATDYHLTAPEQVDAGLVNIRMVNRGKEMHHVLVMKINRL